MAPRKLMIQEPKEVARFDGAAANPNLEKQPMVYTGSKARRVVAQEESAIDVTELVEWMLALEILQEHNDDKKGELIWIER
ncbi:hypothetical protein CDL15_Pgr005132 [Punica granatum]|uniref:Uncharacterized protein n=1 Tax=Punica granatum TaxID=22663 RepID=A0A218WPM2_PUNGR|nr:hypothetical protein CDL15_Pgr005132 [Punica granatum]